MWDILRQSDAPMLYIVYTDYRSGHSVYVTQYNVPNLAYFKRCMLASAAIPGVINGVNECYDGGVRELVPIKYAIDHGATEVVATLLNKKFDKDWSGKSIKKVLERTIDIFTDESLINDLHMAGVINRMVKSREQLKGMIALMPKQEQVRLNIYLQQHADLDKYRVIDIKTLVPSMDMGSALDFNPEDMRKYYLRGIRDASAELSL